ncbi:MAG: dihydrofolate reductase [Firmicutes bacterium]|nr:dihydrofolate reductase [Bacillota bacterium]
MFSFVVAVGRNSVMGKDNRLPWHLPADVRHFKRVTMSGTQTMIMGRKTFLSLPRVLPGRKHIVLTRDRSFQVDHPQVTVVHDFADLLPLAADRDEYYVIGGAEIFRLFFPYAPKIYLTVIDEAFDGDTYFPEYDKSEWQVVWRQEGIVDEKNLYPHTYFILERKTNQRGCSDT